jgi:hypothetical protein
MQFMPQRADQLYSLGSLVIAHGTIVAFAARSRGDPFNTSPNKLPHGAQIAFG